MDSDIRNYLKEVHPRWWARFIRKKEEYIEYLKMKYPDNSLNESLYLFMNGMDFPPTCMVDGCTKKVSIFSNRHSETCSHEHRQILLSNRPEVKEKTIATNMNRYGCANPASSKIVQEKRMKTVREKYGDNISPTSRQKIMERLDNFQAKGKITIKEKYGVSNIGQLPDHSIKIKNTYLEKHGVDHYSKTTEYKQELLLKNRIKYSEIIPNTVSIEGVSDPNGYLLEYYENPNRRYTILCSICNNKEEIPSETLKYRTRNFGTPCGHCSELKKGSHAEKEIREYINSIVGYSAIANDRTLIHPFEIDALYENHKIAVEYNGLFWHNSDKKGSQYHINKLTSTNNVGYRLISIFEDEWVYKKEIVKERLEHIFGLSKKIYYARKCQIKELNTNDAKQFIEKHHIQGYHPASVKLGLIYENDIVAVMTFCKPNIAKGFKNTKDNFWELSRFCAIGSVVGGASKLLHHFINNYNPLEIVTYADRRWSDGGLYNKLGFTFSHMTPPNYWYISNDKRIHRFELRKNSNDDKSLTEIENRRKQGWRHIHDCGSMCFKMQVNK